MRGAVRSGTKKRAVSDFDVSPKPRAATPTMVMGTPLIVIVSFSTAGLAANLTVQ